MAEIKWLGWLDLETTGTDEREDHILEVGFTLTDLVGVPKWAMARVINPEEEHWNFRMNPTVTNMHYKSGLIDDVDQSERTLPSVEEELMFHLNQQNVLKHEIMLAGSGVGHFDKRFVDAQMPKLAKWFAYPVMDVGVIRRFLRFAGAEHLIPQVGDKPHRALDDLNLHLAEYRHYLKLAGIFKNIDNVEEKGDQIRVTIKRLGDMETLLPSKTVSQPVDQGNCVMYFQDLRDGRWNLVLSNSNGDALSGQILDSGLNAEEAQKKAFEYAEWNHVPTSRVVRG